jgi:hypothetical protein
VLKVRALQMSLKPHIPQRTSGLTKTAVNFMDGEMYLLAKIVDIFNPFMNFKTYSTLSTYHQKIFFHRNPIIGCIFN